MRAAGDQVKSPILRLHTLDDPAAGLFVRDGELHGDPLDLVVADDRCQLRAGSLRMRDNPRPADVGDIGDGTVPFKFQFTAPRLQAVVQFVQVLLGL